jgi:hypothetical protein
MDLSDADFVRQQVSAVIIKWDPMGFVPKGKAKGYDPVINEIITSLGPKTDRDMLARNIGSICRKWFGPTAFEKEFEECVPVARKIIKHLS